MSSKKPYSHFDLTVKFLPHDGHYVPAKAREAAEIEQRKSEPSGTLIARMQKLGIYVAAETYSQLIGEADERFAAGTFATAGFGTAWYALARNASVMRRRLLLPHMVAENGERLSSKDLSEQAANGFIGAAYQAITVEADRLNGKDIQSHNRALGRVVGNTALVLSAINHGIAYTPGDDFELQAQARQAGLIDLETARVIGREMGAHPSYAQLADPDSPYSVYLRRNAPNGFYNALDDATSKILNR